MKKIAILAMSVLALNMFAYDVTGLWEITTDVTLNEDLNVLPGGIVQPYNGHFTLTVNGNVNNMGIIQDHTLGYLLTLNCSGNLTNSGIIKNNTVNMNGALQFIATPSPLASIEPAYFNIMTPMPIIGATDLYFRNSTITFMFGGVLDLQNGLGLNLDNCYFNGGNIIGQTGDTPVSYLYMANGSFINNSTGSNLIYAGITLIENNVIATGNCVNNGEIKSWSNAPRTFIAQDNFINNGSISDNPPYGTYFESNGYLENNGTVTNSSVICYGDFTNNASFTPQYFYLSGATVQNITTAFSCPVKSVNTVCLNLSGITSQSDLYFENSLIDFNDNPITLQAGYGLYVSGGYMINTYLTGAGTVGNISYFETSNNCYLQNTDITDLVLNGTVDISDDNCSLNGSVLNYATIQNRSSYNYTLTINGDFDNEGIITSNPGGYYLYTDFRGTYLHNGGTWTNQMLILSGTAAQNISNSYSTPFSPVYLSCDNGNGVIAKSDLEFENSLINFNGNYYIDLTEGHDLYISGGYMNNTRITGAGTTAKALSEFEAANGFYMQNTVLENLVLRGTFEISNDNCSLNGSILNFATIQNKSSYTYTLTVNDDFDNQGILQNGTIYDLNINVNGNVKNSGTWANTTTSFTGTTDQQIVLAYGSEIASTYLYFVSEIVDAPYEWYCNNTPIEAMNPDFSGIDIDVLRWLVPIDLDNSGSYYCQTNAGPTRKIFVYDGILSVPVITGSGYENGGSSIYWESIPSAASYKVFSSSDPYADPAFWTFETEVCDIDLILSGGIVLISFTFLPSTTKITVSAPF